VNYQIYFSVITEWAYYLNLISTVTEILHVAHN